MTSLAADQRPVLALFEDVVGQERAVGQLRASARRPVHAYLFSGPVGSGKRKAAIAMAAALLCPDGGCGVCNVCRRVLEGKHPDVVVLERSGPSISVDDARSITTLAQRRPMEAARQVLIVHDVHLATAAAPALLKTVEEPPPGTFFLLVADEVPSSLVTIVSRCVQVRFEALHADTIAAWLVEHGCEETTARAVAEASGGRLDRARLLAEDPAFSERLARWRAVPQRLNGTGAVAAQTAGELLDALEEGLAPLRARHAQELAMLTEQSEAMGTRGIQGRRDIDARLKREERRWKTDDLRFGLATLAEAYRDRLLDLVPGEIGRGGRERLRATEDIDAIRRASAALGRNVNEQLLLDALLVELSHLVE